MRALHPLHTDAPCLTALTRRWAFTRVAIWLSHRSAGGEDHPPLVPPVHMKMRNYPEVHIARGAARGSRNKNPLLADRTIAVQLVCRRH